MHQPTDESFRSGSSLSLKLVKGQNVSQTGALGQGGSKEVKWGLTRLASESCKSVRDQNVSQTKALNVRGSKNVKWG